MTVKVSHLTLECDLGLHISVGNLPESGGIVTEPGPKPTVILCFMSKPNREWHSMKMKHRGYPCPAPVISCCFCCVLFFNKSYHVTAWNFGFCLIFVCPCVQVWMELLSQAPHQYVVAASCPWMGAWLCLMMQASHIPIDLNMLLEVKARSKVVHLQQWCMKTENYVMLWLIHVCCSYFFHQKQMLKKKSQVLLVYPPHIWYYNLKERSVCSKWRKGKMFLSKIYYLHHSFKSVT